MKDACRYAERPFSLLARYIMVRPVAHAAIVMAVLGAVGCSVGAQYGVKVLVDTLSGGVYADDNIRNAWLGVVPIATLISSSQGKQRSPILRQMRNGVCIKSLTGHRSSRRHHCGGESAARFSLPLTQVI